MSNRHRYHIRKVGTKQAGKGLHYIDGHFFVGIWCVGPNDIPEPTFGAGKTHVLKDIA